MSFLFPVSTHGFWHDGTHRQGSGLEFVKAEFPAELTVYRFQSSMAFPSVPQLVLKSDMESMEPQLLAKAEDGPIPDFYMTFKNLTDSEKEEVLKCLNLSMTSNFIIQKHTICAESSSKKFEYYSLIMHLSQIRINGAVCPCGITCGPQIKKQTGGIIFPGQVLGTYGDSESTKNMIEIEYFVPGTFNIPFSSCESLSYAVLPAGQAVYTAASQPSLPLHIQTETVCTVVTEPDDDAYPASIKLSIAKYAAAVDKEALSQNGLTWKKETTTKAGKTSVTFKLVKNDGTAAQGELLPVKATCTKTDGQTATYSQSFEVTSVTPVDEDTVLIDGDVFGIGAFWTKADNTVLKQLTDGTVRVRKIGRTGRTDTVLPVYEQEPDRKVITASGQTTEHEIRVMKNNVNVFDGHGAYATGTDGLLYLNVQAGTSAVWIKAPSQGAYTHTLWDDFKASITVFTNSQLSDYNPNETEEKDAAFFKKLYQEAGFTFDEGSVSETVSEFMERTKDLTEKCAFQHPSEWKEMSKVPLRLRYSKEVMELWAKLQIWNTKGWNSKLPKDLRDSSRFIFFYPDYFEQQLRKIHEGYAEKLKAVQDKVMAMWMFKQGNIGLYPGQWKGKEQDDGQTYCNHAVFWTIQQVDDNYTNFTDRKKGVFPECPGPMQTMFKKNNNNCLLSNYWCKVLADQAKNSANTGIYEVTGKQAQALANLGYVVIGAWMNRTAGGHPHYVTVRPGYEYNDKNGPGVAHVGSYKNQVRAARYAFGDSHFTSVKWYCNIQECFK